jgi:hypothetical protein
MGPARRPQAQTPSATHAHALERGLQTPSVQASWAPAVLI